MGMMLRHHLKVVNAAVKGPEVAVDETATKTTEQGTAVDETAAKKPRATRKTK